MHGGLARWHETEALLWGGSIEQAKEVLSCFGERVEDKRRYRIPYLQACAVLARWENKLIMLLLIWNQPESLLSSLIYQENFGRYWQPWAYYTNRARMIVSRYQYFTCCPGSAVTCR